MPTRRAYYLTILFLVILLDVRALATPPLKWVAKELVGHRLELVDKTDIQSFRFISDGAVAASTGTKTKNGGVAYPVFYWAIDKQGVLCIYTNPEHAENALFRITKLKVRKSRIVADCNGKERIYSLVKDK